MAQSSNTYWILLMCCWFNHGQFILFNNLWIWYQNLQEQKLIESKQKEILKFKQVFDPQNKEDYNYNSGSEMQEKLLKSISFITQNDGSSELNDQNSAIPRNSLA